MTDAGHCISGSVSNDTEIYVEDMFWTHESFVGF